MGDKAHAGLSFGLDKLKSKFPDLLYNRSLIDHAMKALDSSSQFGAMVIRIDEPPHKDKPSETNQVSNILLDVAGTIDLICRNDNGIWGQTGSSMFGCFFPETDEHLCRDIVKKIQHKLGEDGNKTVTIGIALYPTINFDKDRILDNAYKALCHADFFGPGSAVFFDTISLNISGDHLYQENDINGAIEEFKTALMLDPLNVNVHNSLGVCYGALGAFEKALEHFEQAIQIDSGEIMALHNAGVVNILINNKDNALELLLKAESLGEDIFEVAFQTGKLYLEKKEFGKARQLLEKAVKLRPESVAAFRYLGECYESVQMTDEAVSAYKKAIRLNPNDAYSLSALSLLFDLQGENPEITEIFCQQSIDIAPENGLFRNRLGRIYLKQNKLKEALTEFEKAHDLGYDSMEFIKKTQDMVIVQPLRHKGTKKR
ncbi:MAG: tetratricopeptide repeat protein [Thermodesulfobacteriota bacterium]|nr:tetratricopeptide repeat protein [Thermodesulfobacteriota bacterium]